jgi:hypothetical protein
MYRKDKTGQWVGTLSYNFTKPISPKRGIAKTLKIALLLANKEAAPRTRAEILKMIGVPKKVAEKKGQSACLFTALCWNEVIYYDKTTRTYIQGNRFQEFMQYLTVLKETSKALHFMVS